MAISTYHLVESRNIWNRGTFSNNKMYTLPNGSFDPLPKNIPKRAITASDLTFTFSDLNNMEVKTSIVSIKNSGFWKATFPNILSGQLGCSNDIELDRVANEKNFKDVTEVYALPNFSNGLYGLSKFGSNQYEFNKNASNKGNRYILKIFGTSWLFFLTRDTLFIPNDKSEIKMEKTAKIRISNVIRKPNDNEDKRSDLKFCNLIFLRNKYATRGQIE